MLSYLFARIIATAMMILIAVGVLQSSSAAEPTRRFVLLIEELTRANLAGVLGELITYVEHRQRDFSPLYSRKPVLPDFLISTHL